MLFNFCSITFVLVGTNHVEMPYNTADSSGQISAFGKIYFSFTVSGVYFQSSTVFVLNYNLMPILLYPCSCTCIFSYSRLLCSYRNMHWNNCVLTTNLVLLYQNYNCLLTS